MKTRAVVRKAGDTKAAAVANRTRLVMEIEAMFKQRRTFNPVAETFNTFDLDDPAVDEGMVLNELTSNLKRAGLTEAEIDSVIHGRQAFKDQGKEDKYIDKSNVERAITAGLDRTSTYHKWIEDRIKAELPAPTTISGWRGSTRQFAEWFGSDYLSSVTKEDASKYKNHLLSRVSHLSVKTIINRLKALWNYARDHGEVETNPWDGLTRKLKMKSKKVRVSEELLAKARIKSNERKDIGFWIQIYTGCRMGEHQGLRWSDIDMQNNTIRFEEYTYNNMHRRLKGSGKDERLVPMHSILRLKLLEFLPVVEHNHSDEPIWPEQWRESAGLFGNKWSNNFSRHYNFTSHELRAHVVSQLQLLNISPYYLYEITRHSVPGMSQVVQGYVRPTMVELRKLIERLE